MKWNVYQLSQRGFTFIELTVVLTVIAVLAAQQIRNKVFESHQKTYQQTAQALSGYEKMLQQDWINQLLLTQDQWPASLDQLQEHTYGWKLDANLIGNTTVHVFKNSQQLNNSSPQDATHLVIRRVADSYHQATNVAIYLDGLSRLGNFTDPVSSMKVFYNEVLLIKPQTSSQPVDSSPSNVNLSAVEELIDEKLLDYLPHDGSRSFSGDFSAAQFSIASLDDIQANNLHINKALYFASDARLKTDIENLEVSLAKLHQIKPAQFNWIHQEHKPQDRVKKQFGFIAQNVLATYPQLYNLTNQGLDRDDDDGSDAELLPALRISYTDLLAIMWRHMQQIDLKLDRLQIDPLQIDIPQNSRPEIQDYETPAKHQNIRSNDS